MSLLYDKGLDATTFSRLLRRIESFVIKRNFQKWSTNWTISKINSLIDEIIIDDEKECHKIDRLNAVKICDFGCFLNFESLGKIRHGRYGWNSDNESENGITKPIEKIEITSKTLSEVKENLTITKDKSILRSTKTTKPNHKALAGIVNYTWKTTKNSLFAKLELTQKGADLLNRVKPTSIFRPRSYSKRRKKAERLCQICWSVELSQTALLQSNETIACVRRKRRVANNHQRKAVGSYSDILIFNSNPMKTILELLAEFSELAKINSDQKNTLEAAFNTLDDSDKTEKNWKTLSMKLLQSLVTKLTAKEQEEKAKERCFNWRRQQWRQNGRWKNLDEGEGEGGRPIQHLNREG